jgi:peroxin-5
LTYITLSEISWDEQFDSQAQGHAGQSTNPQENKTHAEEGDELARTAGLLLEAVRHEDNPKFKQSSFLGLMQQLRDGEVVVHGDQMVPNETDSLSSMNAIDLKGKGRVINPSALSSVRTEQPQSLSLYGSGEADMIKVHGATAHDPTSIEDEDSFWRQENAEYTRFWDDVRRKPSRVDQPPASSPWFQLQEDWEAFEAQHTGIRQVDRYEFQDNNPYLLGESSRTAHHSMHDHRTSFIEVCRPIFTLQFFTNHSIPRACWS